jgi:hypothetical protein
MKPIEAAKAALSRAAGKLRRSRGTLATILIFASENSLTAKSTYAGRGRGCFKLGERDSSTQSDSKLVPEDKDPALGRATVDESGTAILAELRVAAGEEGSSGESHEGGGLLLVEATDGSLGRGEADAGGCLGRNQDAIVRGQNPLPFGSC